jgi:hypothetical protein
MVTVKRRAETKEKVRVRLELRIEGRVWASHHRRPTRETTSPPSPESSACCACSSTTFLPVLNRYTFTAFLL